MADQLQYIVKFIPDEASLKEVEDALDKIGKAKPKSGTSPFEGVTRDAEEYGEILNKTLKRLVELNDQLTNNRATIKSLTQASKEGTAEGLESAKQLAILKAENKELSAEYRTQEAVLNANKVAVDGGTMSYAQMSARMRELKDQMRQIVPNTAENVKALEGMKNEYGTLNTKLKEFDASVGNHQRNVGNYENSLRGLASTLAVFQGPLGPIAGRINAFATVLSRLEDAQDDTKESTGALAMAQKVWGAIMGFNIPLIKTTEGSITAMGAATAVANGWIKLFNGGLKLFKLALIGTGVGALVVALGGLVAFFKAGEEGSMAFARKMAPLKAIVSVLRDAFASVGKAITGAFEDPQQAVKDLWELIKTNLVNRIEGVGLAFRGVGNIIKSAFKFDTDGVKAGLAEVGNGIGAAVTGVEGLVEKTTEFGNKIKETARQAGLLEAQMQGVVLAERQLKIERAQQNRNMRETMALARDETKSITERIEATQKIMDAEVGMLQKELTLENERLGVMKAQAALALNSQTENEALMEQEVKIANIEQQHYEKRLTGQETINMLRAKEREIALNMLTTTLTAQQRLSDLEIKRVEDDMKRKGEIVELAELKLLAFDNKLQQERQARIDAYNQEYVNKKFSAEDAIKMATLRADQELESERLDLSAERNEAELNRAKALSDATISINKTQAQVELDNQIEMFTRRGQHAEAFALTLEKIELDRQARIDSLTEGFVSKGILRTEAEALAKKQITLEIDNETARAQRATDDAVFEHKQKLLSAYSSIVTGVGDLLFKDSKAFAVAGAVMDTYGAINKTFREFGYPKGIPFAVAQGIAGFANVKKILATKKGTKTGSASTGSVPSQSVGTSFGLVDVGTNQSAAAFVASQQSTQSQEVNVYLQGEFDPEYLSLKVAQGNNSLAQRTVRIG